MASILRAVALTGFALLPMPAVQAGMPATVPDVTYPTLPTHGKSTADFVPEGWRLESRVRGDLNGDDRTDDVLLLRDNDPRNVISHPGMGENPLNTNPRLLVVVLKRASGGYTRILANHTLIPRRRDPLLSDPISGVTGGDSIQIDDGTLRIRLGVFYGAGSWEMGHRRLSFRWRDNKFILTGYGSWTVHRNTGKTDKVSYDFPSHRVKHVSGNIAGGKETVKWRNLPARPLLTMEQVGNGLDFNPERRPQP